MRCRFIERDEVFKLIQRNSKYITYEQINNILDSMDTEWADLTFVFTPNFSGFKTKVIDNSSEEEISLDDLSPIAWNYYVNKIKELSLVRVKNEEDKVREQIKKIREILVESKTNGTKKYA